MNENEPTDSKATSTESTKPTPPAEVKSALDAAKEKARAAAEAIRAHDFKGDARKAAEGMRNLQEKLRERGAPLVGTIASKAKGRKPVIVGSAVAILLVLLVLGRMFGSSGGASPESVAKAAFRALHDGDFDAYRAVTVTEGIDPDLLETGFRFGNEVYKDCDFSDFKFGKARIDGNSAFVPWSLPDFGGDEIRLLRKSGGSWRVWPSKDAPPEDFDRPEKPSSGGGGGSAASAPAKIAEAFVTAICKGDKNTIRKYADGPKTLEKALDMSSRAQKEISRFAGASATLSDDSDPEAGDCFVFEVRIRDSAVPDDTVGMEVWIRQNAEGSDPRWVVCLVRL